MVFNPENRSFLSFEETLQPIWEDYRKLVVMHEEGKVDLSEKIAEMESVLLEERQKIQDSLDTWQRVQISRHTNRPYSLFYCRNVFSDFMELHGDRTFGDDKAIVGGLADLDGQTVMVVGHQKGIDTKMRQYRNFGMPNPEGYRKAHRLFKLAEKFQKPVITFIDTPGAYPGIEAEERGQAEAIARNIHTMLQLRVPVISVIIGEGASGGAIGIGVADKIMMLENTWFSVISPESCSSILWRSWDHKEQAAEQLNLTAQHMHKLKVVDTIIKEPAGGAHHDPVEAAKAIKRNLKRSLTQLAGQPVDEMLSKRREKYFSMGVYDEIST